MNGRVIINRNICDNAPECSGIEVCPTGAIYWDENSEKIEYNREVCIDCGACANPDLGGCPVEAILWGEDDADYERKKELVENETMTLEKLQVERYGAAPMKEPISVAELTELLHENDGIVLAEFFCDDSINCLVHSIPVSDIVELFDCDTEVKYYKVQICEENDSETLCKISEMPALAIFLEQKCVGVINGYYEDNEESRKEFFELIQSAIQH